MKLQPHIERVLATTNALAVFGLILFTDEHPHVVKTLRDEDYWKEFDKISGDTFAIFSAKPKPGQYRLPPPSPPGKLAMMYMIWEEPAENQELLTTFHLENTKGLPKFVVFVQMPDNTILQCSLPLSDDTEDAAHRRLKEVLQFVSNAAKGIASEYKSDTANVYEAFAQQIRQKQERELLITAVTWIPFVNNVLKMVRP